MFPIPSDQTYREEKDPYFFKGLKSHEAKMDHKDTKQIPYALGTCDFMCNLEKSSNITQSPFTQRIPVMGGV
jgi:hypothetical protein